MMCRGRQSDVVCQGVGQERMPVGVLKLHRQLETVRPPRNRDAKPQTDGQAGVPGRKPLHPKRVPSATQDEQLPTDCLDGVSEKCDVDTWAERVWG